jgi:NADH-quinone oxidoreductase subunit L
LEQIYLLIPLAPLFGAIVAGLFGRKIGRAGAHWVTIAGVTVAFVLSLVVLKHHVIDGAPVFNAAVYTWLVSDGIEFQVGFLIDNLTVLMITVVTAVSLAVHVYTIGYMEEDPGYQRFFSYIALFTFAMLMLVMSNNFLQLFFGWEAVGVVSYLLIGFWFKRETAIYANLKAFLVNRVGDFGFLLGIAAIVTYFGTLDYALVFAAAPDHATTTIALFGEQNWSLMTVICIFLFISAMGKSAQVPLHVWLPDSMEGPTPISALIHAATMVTAGIFMVARMSPLFELSETALSVVMIIGAITALFMGLVGIVQNDIKRVVAYSTLSQLGYMTVALGASAYSVAIFHLMTHAFFKALLFLAAGSVIIAMHHEQDIRAMGGLRRKMPITYITSLVGSLALIGTPFFSGYFSKDAIILAVSHAQIAGAGFAYFAVTIGVFITAFYSFRMFFLVFHGESRVDPHTAEHLHETKPVVTLPLIALAIPSVIIGGLTIEPAIEVAAGHETVTRVAEGFHGAVAFSLHAFVSLPFYLALAGVVSAWYLYLHRPELAGRLREKFSPLHLMLTRKYWCDEFNSIVFAGGGRTVGRVLWRVGDESIIDGFIVNGAAHTVGRIAQVMRHLQTGFLYHYAFAMIIGLLLLLTLFVMLAYF